MACTGIEFCKLAIVDTKERARQLVASLEQRFPELDTPITVNVNGCPNSCARTQVADIGLKGQLVLDDDGRQVEGFQVHLGGGLGLDPKFGRKLRAHKVTSAGLGDYVCPPSGLAMLWNALKCPKKIVWVQGSQHGYVPPEYEGRDFVIASP